MRMLLFAAGAVFAVGLVALIAFLVLVEFYDARLNPPLVTLMYLYPLLRP